MAQLPAQAQADFDDAVEREKKMNKLRAGTLNYFDAEQLTQEECAKGDAAKRAAAEKAERELRETGARLRAGGYLIERT